MQGMKSIAQILFLMLGVVISIQAVWEKPVLNYAGQVAVNGEAFDGNGLFKFALVNADGNESLIGAMTERVWTDRNLGLRLPFQ